MKIDNLDPLLDPRWEQLVAFAPELHPYFIREAG